MENDSSPHFSKKFWRRELFGGEMSKLQSILASVLFAAIIFVYFFFMFVLNLFRQEQKIERSQELHQN
jgi:preprotein translocase subunit YajC